MDVHYHVKQVAHGGGCRLVLLEIYMANSWDVHDLSGSIFISFDLLLALWFLSELYVPRLLDLFPSLGVLLLSLQ